jgi:hypothetical protein
LRILIVDEIALRTNTNRGYDLRNGAIPGASGVHTPLLDATRRRGSGVLAGAADVIATCTKPDRAGNIVGFSVLLSRDT